jgi:hypothetical protein
MGPEIKKKSGSQANGPLQGVPALSAPLSSRVEWIPLGMVDGGIAIGYAKKGDIMAAHHR